MPKRPNAAVAILLAASLSPLAPSAARAGGGAKSNPEVFGVQVYRRPSESGPNAAAPFEKGTESNLSLELLLRTPDCDFLGLAPDPLRVTRYTDERNDEMALGVGMRLTPSGRAPLMSPEEHAVALTLSIQRAPPAGATKLLFKGEASLVCGAGAKKSHRQKASLKPGTVIESGPFTIRIASFGNNPSASQSMARIEVTGPLQQLVSMHAMSSSGQDLLPVFRQNGPRIFNNGMSQWHSYVSMSQQQDATFEVQWYEKTKIAAVPLEFETGIGL